MKRLLLLACISLIHLTAHGRCLVTAPPVMEFEEAEYDYGMIPEGAKKVSHDFVFTNTGETPLVITRVITSTCKCVSTSHTRRPVPPGEEGVITVTYDPKKQRGIFYKAIQVFSNTEEGLEILIIKGEVVENP